MNLAKKIFIAEDEEILREVYADRFKQDGFEVKTFKDGLELLAAISSETPDLVLLDLKMPEMDGYEVLEKVHKVFRDGGKQNIPIIVWSNSNSETGVSQALQMGAIAYLKKVDYSGQDLVDKVKLILNSLPN